MPDRPDNSVPPSCPPCPSCSNEGPRAEFDGVLRASDSLAIIVTDAAGVIRVFNAGAEDMLGYRAEELLGRATPEILHLPAEMDERAGELSRRLGRPVSGFGVFAALAGAAGPGGCDRREWTLVRKDGRRIVAELGITGVYEAGGRPSGWLAVARDLSAGKAMAEELRRARLSVDNAGDLIIWGDIESGRIVFANRAACRALGYPSAELLALTIPDISPTRSLESWRAHGQALRDLGPTTAELPLRRKNGGLFYVEATSSLVEHEGRVCSLGIMHDVTRRRELEAELRQARVGMDSVRDMILWVRVEDRRVAYANRAACEWLGYAKAELLGLDVARVNPEHAPENWNGFCAGLRRGAPPAYETRYRRDGGGLIDVEVAAVLVVHEHREYVVACARDITARKAAQEGLGRETRLNAALAEAAGALLEPGRDMNAVAELLLARARELTGSPSGYVAFVDPDSGRLRPRAMSAASAGGGCAMGRLPVTFPPEISAGYRGLWGHSLNTRQGFFTNDPANHPAARGLPEGHMPLRRLLSVPAVCRERLVGQIVLGNADRDYDAADLAAVTALADIFALGAEQQLSQRALLDAKNEAERSSRAKSDFLANMTHEVRTPLNGVLGMLQVLGNTGLDADQREYVAVALEAAERLNALIGDVIEYARLDTLSEALDCRYFPPNDLFSALRAVHGPAAAAKGLDFDLRVEPGLPELLRSDPRALRLALDKLLDNAVKFTHAGRVVLAVAPVAPIVGEPARMVFSVEDTGVGIAPEQRARAFEAFSQCDAGVTRAFGGAGLGLAIVRRLAELLGGDVRIGERTGGGTVIRLTIPVDCGPQNAA